VNGLAKYLDGIIGGIIGTVFGTICVHRLALWRDRRKEFNEIAQPIRELLLKERNAGSPNQPGLTALKADQIENVLPWWEKRSFRSTWNAYEKSKENITRDSMGGVSYEDFDEIAGHIDGLLRYTKRR
jgi:hypothetical protein